MNGTELKKLAKCQKIIVELNKLDGVIDVLDRGVMMRRDVFLDTFDDYEVSDWHCVGSKYNKARADIGV